MAHELINWGRTKSFLGSSGEERLDKILDIGWGLIWHLKLTSFYSCKDLSLIGTREWCCFIWTKNLPYEDSQAPKIRLVGNFFELVCLDSLWWHVSFSANKVVLMCPKHIHVSIWCIEFGYGGRFCRGWSLPQLFQSSCWAKIGYLEIEVLIKASDCLEQKSKCTKSI